MFLEHVRMAYAAVKAARFRSFLTMLGIIIGVFSVITTVSIGEGIKHQISGQASSVGSDLITVRPGKLVKRDEQGRIKGLNLLAFLSSSVVSEKDLQSINQNPLLETTVPFSIVSGVPSIDKDQFSEGFIMATNEKMPHVSSQKIEFGNFFTKDDNQREVAVIGQGVAEKLFKENVPIGKSFQIRGHDFVVGGVFEKSPSNPLNPEIDFNNGVFIPYEAGKKLAGNDLQVYQVLSRPKAKDPASVDAAIASINSNLKQNHSGQDDFTVLRQDDMSSLANSFLHLITNSVTIMAAVTLLVGGVGIMNVMLVSVTERTREIGIRKAVGATNTQIQSQFLIEAIVISVWGAFIGVFMAIVINLLLRIFTNLQPLINWQSVLIAAGVSIIVGIVFGMIPAVKASRKDPIEALRSF